jgi:ferritin-like metal-binding protein YciE
MRADDDEGATMPETIQDHVSAYLSDAHSIEEQALAQLRSIPRLEDAPRLAAALEAHLAETEDHERAVARLLAEREAAPSRFKDLVMQLGGKGFVLFARLNEDTPGKLLAHAYAYEALEEASYALLGLVGERAGAAAVVSAAARIEAEEIAMKARLAGCFDEGAAASLAAVDVDIREQLGRYLADAHAIEEQAIGLLERAADASPDVLAEVYRAHLAETREQSDAVSARLHALGRDRSVLRDAAMRVGAINWAAFFAAHPDTPGKLAAFAFAFEHLEIGGYEQLRRVAERAGDEETAELARHIADQERSAAARIRDCFAVAADAVLA